MTTTFAEKSAYRGGDFRRQHHACDVYGPGALRMYVYKKWSPAVFDVNGHSILSLSGYLYYTDIFQWSPHVHPRWRPKAVTSVNVIKLNQLSFSRNPHLRYGNPSHRSFRLSISYPTNTRFVFIVAFHLTGVVRRLLRGLSHQQRESEPWRCSRRCYQIRQKRHLDLHCSRGRSW